MVYGDGVAGTMRLPPGVIDGRGVAIADGVARADAVVCCAGVALAGVG